MGDSSALRRDPGEAIAKTRLYIPMLAARGAAQSTAFIVGSVTVPVVGSTAHDGAAHDTNSGPQPNI
jgi:hypothetical protein